MPRVRVLALADLGVVLVLALSALGQVWTSPVAELGGGRGVHSLLVAGFTLPLMVRRRFAVAVFAIVIAAAWLQLQLGGGLGQPFFAVILALYSVGAHASLPATLVGPGAVVLMAVFVDGPRLRDGEPWDQVVPAWFILFAVWAFGRWMRRRAVESAALNARAEAAERDKEEQAARAVADERARIARELHDLVAHSMGVIVIQAQGAQRAIDTAPEQARAALASIETAGRTGLAEMRRLLELLSPEPGDADTTPQPTLEQLPDLIARVREAGLTVDLRIDGVVRALPAGVELTGYRVVQEAMTNVLKHAEAAPVEVRLRYEPECLDIEVRDAGRADGVSGDGAESGGRGLIGMQERVSLYGGTVRAARRPEGGFVVHARIPVDGRQR
ncbi:histidine kinase [Kribbella sp. NBC_01245]|uniref:sensor histidine kinase n=1 Tax=Kribbella sp. NBC_01245 TaxID=2903578 RepID=UPI002E2A1C36|nr:histidine kinase [Kribbella sp. NBC_01245]